MRQSPTLFSRLGAAEVAWVGLLEGVDLNSVGRGRHPLDRAGGEAGGTPTMAKRGGCGVRTKGMTGCHRRAVGDARDAL